MQLIKQVKEWAEDWLSRWPEARFNQRRVGFLEEVLPKEGIGAELGVFKGRFSPLLFRHSKAKELHLIDPWYFLTDYWHWGRGNRSTVVAVMRILRQWKKEIEQKKVYVHIGDDREVLKSFPDGYFDWVYIDSSHDYAHTVDELNILMHKVKPEGVIAGDDWQPNPEHRHHGVCKAVNEFVGSRGYALIYANDDNHQWAIKKSN